jgi:hypothetical protein
LEGITVKPKEGSLREELEKIKKNKMEETEKWIKCPWSIQETSLGNDWTNLR